MGLYLCPNIIGKFNMFKWFEIAQNEQGTQEISGKKHNPAIVQYFANVGHVWVKDDETPWCAAFVGSCLENAGITSTKALNARSYLKWGREIAKPVAGCIVVFKRGKSSWQGHVAFYIGQSDDRIKVLGGNQGNEVKVSTYSKDDLLGYRMPKTKMNSKTNWAAGVGGAGVIASQAEHFGKAIDKVNGIARKGGDLADQVGGIANAVTWPIVAIAATAGLFIFIIFERNKKVTTYGL